MDDQTREAVEAIKVASVLFEQYRTDAASLATATISLEDRLRALDLGYAGLWENIGRAAGLLEQAGLDLSRFEEIAAAVKERSRGYHERREEKLTLDGYEQEVSYRIKGKRVALTRDALAELQRLVPGQQWRMARDREVEAYLAGQRTPLRFLKPLVWTGGIGVVVGGVLLVFQLMRPRDYGDRSREIHALEREHEERPCDKKLVVKLAEALNQAGAHDVAVKRAEEHISRCGENRKLRWASFTAYKKMKRLEGAVAEVSRLIALVPRDRDYRWWRGDVHLMNGDADAAIEDYRQAVALDPFLLQIPIKLSRLLEQQGRPCEALFWLEGYLHHHPRQRGALQARRVRLLRSKECAALQGRGAVDIPLPPQESEPARVQGRIDGAAPTAFEVQRDIVYVMLTRKEARRHRLSEGPGAEILVRTPDGFFEGRLRSARKMELGGASARDVAVVVVKELPRDVGGIIGQSFLARFVSRVAAGELRLTSRAGTGAGPPSGAEPGRQAPPRPEAKPDSRPEPRPRPEPK